MARHQANLFSLVAGILLMISASCKGPEFQPVFVCPSHDFALPDLLKDPQNHGFLDAPGGKLFYWLIPAQLDPATAPVVLWLNGGPGSSSLLGMFFENGPYFLNRDMTTYANPYSWNRKAHILYIDQPAGVGFSRTAQSHAIPTSEDEIATRLNMALNDFFTRAHPELKDKDFYVFGESFAGTYIPWLASKILDQKTINLKGIGIGDGTIDNPTNWKWQSEYALQNGLILPGHYDFINAQMWPSCERELAVTQERKAAQIPAACAAINRYIRDVATNVNYYDVEAFGTYDFQLIECFLNNAAVKATLGIEKENAWKLGNEEILNARAGDAIFTTIPLIKRVLDDGKKVLVYHGENDLLINYLGAEAWLQRDFGIKQTQEWRIGDKLVGRQQSEGNLSYTLIYDAGHLVPFDQPAVALEMFEKFILP